jgi:hypothetical protein
MNKKVKILLITLTFIGFTVILIGSILLFTTDYQEFIAFIVEKYGLAHKAEKLQQQFITPRRFLQLKYVVGLFCTICFVFLFFCLKEIEQTISFFNSFFAYLIHRLQLFTTIIKELSLVEKKGIVGCLFIITAARLYFVFIYPVHIDEAFGYVFFLNKGFLATLSYYPGPNNHVGYNVFATVLLSLGLPTVLSLRLPVFVFATLFSAIYFLIITKKWGFSTALTSFFLFSFSEYGMFYAAHARGYYLQLLCLLMSSLFLYSFYKQNRQTTNEKFDLLFFILFSAWGFWAIPTYLYAFVCQATIYILFGRQKKTFLIALLLTVGVVLLLYAPILLSAGINAITGNNWVKPITKSNFSLAWWDYFNHVNGVFYSLESIGTLLQLLLYGLLLYFYFTDKKNNNTKDNTLIISILIFSLLPFVLIYLQKVLPFPRIWLYKSAVEYLGWGYVIARITIACQRKYKHQEKNVLGFYYFSCGIYVVILVAFLVYQIRYKSAEYKALAPFLAKISTISPKIIFTDYDFYNVFLRYDALEKNKSVHIDCPTQSKDKIYELYIYKKETKRIENQSLSLIYEDDFVKVYER